MRKTIDIAAIAVMLLSLGAGWAYAQQAAAPGRAAAAPGPPPAPQMLFKMTMQNDTRKLLAQDSITTPNVDLHLYGDKNIVVAVGQGANAPRTFFGLCEKPCGFTLSDRSNYFDLRGRASIKFTTEVSGFHRVRPLIKLTDGTLLIGDQAEGSVSDFHPYQISFLDVKWLKLDPDRGVTLATWVNNVDLSKVAEVGYFDVLPGSGVHVEGVPTDKLPAPPAGGWIVVSAFELWGQPVSRDVRISEQR
jgi:hypothetical protein